MDYRITHYRETYGLPFEPAYCLAHFPATWSNRVLHHHTIWCLKHAVGRGSVAGSHQLTRLIQTVGLSGSVEFPTTK
jgi:hypothetical protein